MQSVFASVSLVSSVVIHACLVPYIELHTASAFSFLQGASLPEALVDRAAELGYPALALLDRDGVYGAPRFHKAARAAGIKPIIGAELTIGHGGQARQRQEAGRPGRDNQSQPGLPASPAHPSLPCPSSAKAQEGYRNLCRLITRMKLRAPKGEGALDARRSRRARRAAWSRSSGARRSTAGATASAGCSIALVGIFGRESVYVELQRHFRRDEEADNETLVDLAAAFRVPIARDQRRPLRHAGRAAAVRRAHLHPSPHRSGAGAGRRLAPNAERYLKPPADMAALFADRAGCGRRTGGARRSPAVHDGRSRLPLSRLPGAAGRNAGVVSPPDHRGRRARSLPAVSRSRARADRARARSDREARSRRLLPDRLGHRQFLPAARHPRAGAGVGGQQRRVLQPRHHGGRSGRDGSAVRAVSLGGARRVARHRSRSAERRSARAGHSARLREVRPPRRGDDRQRHHLSRPQRRARSGEGARVRAAADRSAREGDEQLRVHRSGRHAAAPPRRRSAWI